MPVAEKQFEFDFFDKLLNNKQTHFSVCIESDVFDLDRTIRGFFTCDVGTLGFYLVIQAIYFRGKKAFTKKCYTDGEGWLKVHKHNTSRRAYQEFFKRNECLFDERNIPDTEPERRLEALKDALYYHYILPVNKNWKKGKIFPAIIFGRLLIPSPRRRSRVR